MMARDVGGPQGAPDAIWLCLTLFAHWPQPGAKVRHRALTLLESRVNNQTAGDPKNHPMSDRVSLSCARSFGTKRAEKADRSGYLWRTCPRSFVLAKKKIATLSFSEARQQWWPATPASLIAEGDARSTLGDIGRRHGSPYKKVPASATGIAAAENRRLHVSRPMVA